MTDEIGYSYAQGSASATWTLLTPGANATFAPRAEALPFRVVLDSIAFHFVGVAGGATTATFFLSRAAAGSPKLTPSNTPGAVADLDFLSGSVTEADAIWEMGALCVILEDTDVVTVGVKLDAGTATLVEVRVTWRKG